MKTIQQLTEGITPLPWHRSSSCDISDFASNAVAETYGRYAEDAEANAAYIVLACNSLPKLVQALQQIAAIEHPAKAARAALKEVLG